MKHLRVVIALVLSVVLGGAGLAAAPPAAAASTTTDDVATMVSRLQQYYLGQGDEIQIANGIYLAQTSDAMDYVASQNADGSWSDVDYADTTSSANGAVWKPYLALYRMVAMAQAYRDPSVKGYQSPDIIDALNRALEYWDQVKPTCKNWWETEIGESLAMGRISIFVGDELSSTASNLALKYNIGKLDPVGANGSWRTTNYLLKAIATDNVADIKSGFDTIVQTVRIDNSGTVKEAVQPDDSFWCHGAQLYSEGYGMILFQEVALWADVSRGTSLAFSRDDLDAIASYIIDGTRWLIRGEIGMLYLNYRPPTTVDGVTSYAAVFIEPLTEMVRADPLYASEYQALLDNIEGKTPSSGAIGDKYFWRSEFSSHQRPDYGIFTRVNSNRMTGSEYRSTFRPEVGNEIVWNSAGATAIQVNNHEYSDLGPAFDWDHYPGVTAPYVKSQEKGSTSNGAGGSFTGGVSDGTYGATVYSLDRASTQGSKSYYYFDDEMVALGAGISSTSDAEIHTTVNQASSKDNASVDGTAVPLGTDSQTVTDPSWAYNDQVGYVFPTGQDIKVSNKTQTGSWVDQDPQSHNAFSLYFDHGVKPTNASYEYIVLPAKTAAETQAYASDPAVTILQNDTKIQAVQHAGLKRTMATFYQPGTLDLGNGQTLTVDQPAIVMLDQSGTTPVVSIANPDTPNLVVNVTLTTANETFHDAIALGSGASLGKTVTAPLVPSSSSTTFTASSAAQGSDASFAGDGNDQTAWHSAGDGSAWLEKELTPGSFLTKVSVAWGPDAAKQYVLQTSMDGKTWTDRQFTQDGSGGNVDLDIAPTPASFVRILMVDSTTGNGYSVKEMTTEASVNLAAGKTATASGSSGGAASTVTDGNMGTRWDANNSDTSWVQVDLGSVQPIKKVRLWWEASYAKQYKIEVSDDGQTWRDAYTTDSAGSDGGVDLVDINQSARYIRMQTVKRSTTQYGVSLWEMEVFGDDRITDQPPATTARQNLALGQPITADSEYDDTLAPTYANDGNATTRWASQRQAAPYTTERWLQVDLGKPQTINEVDVTWETATSNDYRVEGSTDGTHWAELAHVQKTSDDLSNVVDFAPVTVQYVRLIGLPATKYGWSIYEFEVYGGYNLTCDTSTSTVAANSTKAVTTANISPVDQGDTVAVTSLDNTVATVTGSPTVDADGRIHVGLTTGAAGSTSLLFTHSKGNEYVMCPVAIALNTDTLEQLIARANALDSMSYTPASWSPLLPALEAAKATLADTNATQTDVDQAAANLSKALDGLVKVQPDTTAPTITVTSDSVGKDGVYSDVNFKLYDAGLVDKVEVNGTAKDLTDSVWSDLDGVRPGVFGAVEGPNTLKVYDLAGNVATATFTLDTTKPTVTVKDGPSFTVVTDDGYRKVSFALSDAGKIDKVTLNGTVTDLKDATSSELDGIVPGVDGAVEGANTLKVYDLAGNATTVTFTLDGSAPTPTPAGGGSATPAGGGSSTPASGSGLPGTGVPIVPMGVLVVVALAAGGLLLVSSRRSRRSHGR